MTETAFCTVWHPSARCEVVRSLVKGKVVDITATTVEEALKQLPTDIHTPLKETVRVVILRAPRDVMESLRGQGWHTGFWRDEVTGQDNGVRRLFVSTTNKSGRSVGLCQIARALHDEVQQIPNGVVTLWHDEITRDMIESEDLQVIEISATSPDAAIAKLKEFINDKST